MKIVFFCWEFPPVGSGIGRYVAEMSSALRDIGHQTVIATSRAAGCPEREESGSGVIYRCFDRADMRSKRVAERVLDIARRHGADWIEGADHWGECAPLLRLRNRPPVVVKMHYNDVLKTPRHAQAWRPWQKMMIDLACVRQWRSIRAEQDCLEHADILLASCQKIMDEAERQRLKLPKFRTVAPNPIPSLPHWENREADSPTLLMVGRCDIGKGIGYLPKLLSELAPDFPGLRLEIRGDDSYARGLGSMRAWLERQLGPLMRHVRFLDFLDREALDDAYRRAWVVMVPSRWDTFPQVVLEAMVRKKAIAASPFGGMPEMLADTSCAVAEPSSHAFAGAIARFLDDPARRRQAGESACRRAAQAYAPAQVARDYVEFISAHL